MSAALVDLAAGSLLGRAQRCELDGAAPADLIVSALVAVTDALPVPESATWGVAVPDPFDYARGVALFEGVGKFESLYGLDLRGVLIARLPGAPRAIAFGNDADAFALGEWAYGAGAGHRRCLGLTLGTGVGSGWIVDGRVVGSGPGIPRGGRARELEVDGGPLEDTISSRGIRRAYQAATGGPGADVGSIAERARDGDPAARSVLRYAMRALGSALGPCLRDFGADIVVVGGSMSASWDLFEPWVRGGFPDDLDPPPIRLARDSEHSALLGAALFAQDAHG